MQWLQQFTFTTGRIHIEIDCLQVVQSVEENKSNNT
jgi:hypothetical protein